MFDCSYWPRRYAYAHGYARGVHDRPFYETRAGRHGRFGVRRPLRYLSYHLDLDEDQRRKLAASIERIKLEREQARLDRKKSDSALADTLVAEDFSLDDLNRALSQRTQIGESLQAVLARELYEIARVLDREQREEFAHLLRSGVLRL